MVVVTMRTTKQDLINRVNEQGIEKQMAIGRAARLELRENDLRKRFSTVLVGYRGDGYSWGTTTKPLSWEEIFCEVGKLLSKPKEDYELRLELKKLRDDFTDHVIYPNIHSPKLPLSQKIEG